jgi:hypothetical protein
VNEELERMRKEAVVANLRKYPGLCLEILRKSTKNLSGQPLSGPRFEPGTSRVPSWSVKYSTKTFGKLNFKLKHVYNHGLIIK